MSDIDTRDRVIRLEADLAHAVKKIDAMDQKVTAMHELMIQGRLVARVGLWSGKWAERGIVALIAFAVSQLGGFLHLPR